MYVSTGGKGLKPWNFNFEKEKCLTIGSSGIYITVQYPWETSKNGKKALIFEKEYFTLNIN